jgi:hypothetical protein
VGPSGAVGELHGGRWYGGHYGWTWPHGLHSVEAAAMVAGMNDFLITGDEHALDLARTPLRLALEKGVRRTDIAAQGSLGAGWAQKLEVDSGRELLVVPYRIDDDGWFDYHPLPVAYPMWLWWLTGSAEDQAMLEHVEQSSGYDWSSLRWAHDKEEQGHETAWLGYLAGSDPDYPVKALRLALAQVVRRISLIRQTPHGPVGDDIHWWQRLNPVVVEILLQLTTGSPPALYNGGLQFARVLFGDARRGRPGLPPEIAGLVERIGETVSVRLVNLSATDEQELILQAGAFGEDRIDRVHYDEAVGDDYPGASTGYSIPSPRTERRSIDGTGTSRMAITMPPLTTLELRLDIARRAFTPAHMSFAHH